MANSPLFFISGRSGLQTAWRKDLRGGAPPSQFVDTRVAAGGIAVSPDSRWVALRGEGALVLPIGGGAPVRRLPAFPDANVQWTPNGETLADLDAAGINLWIQPIDGRPAHALTHFTDQTIFAFGWSSDGKRLALSRGVSSSDIVLLKGSNEGPCSNAASRNGLRAAWASVCLSTSLRRASNANTGN